MSEHWSLSNGPQDPTPATGAAPSTGPAIPLPEVGADPGSPDVGADPTGELRPTGPIAVPGPPTPAAGTWLPPTGSVWAPGPPTGAPYPGGYAGGGVPPTGGWPHPGYSYPAPQPSAPRKGRGAGAMAAVAAVAAVVVLVAGVGLGHAVWPNQNTSTSASAPTTGGGATSPFGSGSSGGSSASPFGSGSGPSGNTSTGAGAPSDIAAIAAKVSPALVDINTNLSYQNEQAAGTGMVLTSDGVILTNNHVIDGATSISVTDIGNGKTYTANVLGYDRTGDVAVIKLVSASGLQTISTASSSAAVGQAVVAIGNAGGTGGTPSTAGGSVTAVNQSITASDNNGANAESLTGLIETNADIQPGDSGGSLVNTSSQVIGMDTAASTGTGYQVSGSQGYAIPIATALSLAKQIEAGKASSTVHIGATGFLGVSVANAGAGSSGGSGLGGGLGGFGGSSTGGSGPGGSGAAGAQVAGTLAGSPSAKAGLVQGDVITGLNGKTVGSANDLTTLLQSHHPGDTVQLTWTDTSGQSQTASVTLTTGPPA